MTYRYFPFFNRKIVGVFQSDDGGSDQEEKTSNTDSEQVSDSLEKLTLQKEAKDLDKGEGGRDIVKEDVKLPECFKDRLAFVLHNVFTKKVHVSYYPCIVDRQDVIFNPLLNEKIWALTKLKTFADDKFIVA